MDADKPSYYVTVAAAWLGLEIATATATQALLDCQAAKLPHCYKQCSELSRGSPDPQE